MNTLDNICFEERGEQIGIFMPGRYWVPEAEIKLAWAFAIAHLDEIDWTKRVCTETFFTADIWKQFPISFRVMLGRCLKFFCAREMLPIEVANLGKKGKRYYRRRR